MRRSAGCVGVVAALVLVIVVVGALVVGTRDSGPDRLQVPADVPPAAAGPVEDVAGTASALRIPEDFLTSYLDATETVSAELPDCGLRWNTLAGLGYAESHHGTYGVEDGKIIGPRLDGTGGFMEIPDTDDGRLDGDTEYDRALGPLQFLPDSWRLYGDGDPQDIADAAVAAGRLLCAGDRDLSTSEDWAGAVFAYNHSDRYLADVRDAAANYALGQSAN
ncbi:lytic transglycosylase domain-containing protein [Corynebacterium variabile]|uniref:lytic transglycosylase domain-containing protein n=1 Tax=Corynebacterium variabile TaxID=1727 RepID=UPI0028E582BF|nr:lytic transglycosylase domain-containing protein [Corynebacterium variabile]